MAATVAALVRTSIPHRYCISFLTYDPSWRNRTCTHRLS